MTVHHAEESSTSRVSPWPRPIACRTSDSNSRDVFVTTLGDVRTPLADGEFDPAADTVRLASGGTIEHYYRDRLRVHWYRPIDKSVFSLPPSGWCSWYYYYQQISAGEIRLNAAWMGRRLREYGARYCQIDDGWQGKGHGNNDNRDWTTIDKRFPDGMAALATYIREQGLEPGIWLAPHGQSNAEVVRTSGAFLVDAAGKSISDTWEGNYLVDPTRPAAESYLRGLFKKLCDDGYNYFKIDGQPIVIEEYRKHAAQMARPAGDTVAAYRETLGWIRDTLGPNRFLLGCWGTPMDGIGIMNGSRIGGDVVPSFDGLKIAAGAILRGNYLNNIVWYADPDVFLVRPPLSLDSARAWASMVALTGQALLTSDRLPDLPESRVEILRRVYPAVDIRPLDLFDPGERLKPIWDLKVNAGGRQWDVVGCFNFDPRSADTVHLCWRDLGLKADGLYHVFDFWNHEYVGCWETGVFVPTPAGGCTVLTLVEARDEPQLISTDRHITQGWIDLLESGYDATAPAWHGRSKLIGGDPYTITFAFPRTGTTYQIASAQADGAAVTIENHQGWATVRLMSPRSCVVDWRVQFEPAKLYRFSTSAPSAIKVERIAPDGARVTWKGEYHGNCGYAVMLDDELLGIAPMQMATLRGMATGGKHTIRVYSVWSDGRRSKEAATLELEAVK